MKGKEGGKKEKQINTERVINTEKEVGVSASEVLVYSAHLLQKRGLLQRGLTM